MTSPLTLNIRELVHSQSQMDIKTYICNKMILCCKFISEIHQKRKSNIALSLKSQMRNNGSPTRHPTTFLMSIKHQYSTLRELYMMINLLMTGYYSPLIRISVHYMFQNITTGSHQNICHRFGIAF